MIKLNLIIVSSLFLNFTSPGQWNYSHYYKQRDYYSVKFFNENVGYIGGESIIAKNTNAGVYWSKISSVFGFDALAIDFWDENNGEAVGQYSYQSPGFIVSTTNGGSDWNIGYRDLVPAINDVILIDSGPGWAVGNGGNIFKKDLFDSWKFKVSVSSDLLSVFFINPNIGWAVGVNKIIRTHDGGINWFEINTGVISTFYDVFFLDDVKGWITARYQLLRTTDGGNTWTSTPLSTLGWKIIFLNESLGFIAGSGNILKTTDGGNTWITITIPGSSRFTAIAFTNENTGYLVGIYNTLYKTSDSGETWFPMIMGDANNLRAIHMNTINIGVAVGENGTILTKKNGDWFNAKTNIISKLNSIYTIDGTTALAVGDSGTVIKSVNSFSDWSAKNSWVDVNLTCISFSDINHGWIVGNNGTVLKTTNAGEVWTKFQSVQPKI